MDELGINDNDTSLPWKNQNKITKIFFLVTIKISIKKNVFKFEKKLIFLFYLYYYYYFYYYIYFFLQEQNRNYG